MRTLMKVKLTIGFCSVVLWGAAWSTAIAYVGEDPVIQHWESCKLTELTARLGPDGSIRYSVMGTCYNNPITGELAYATNRQMAEKFTYRGAKISTKALCPNDPWISGATCEDQQVSVQGADPGSLIYQKVPLSLFVIREAQVFQHAKANAIRPNPPGPPVNARAEIKGGRHATVYWLGPDQQGHFGPYLNFVVEARPKGAEGAAWTKLGGVNRHTAPDYRLAVTLPQSIPGFSGWELRTCATTVLARTCTGPFSPTMVFYKERLAPVIGRDKTGPPLTIQKENSILQSSKPQIGAPQNSSPNQQGTGNASAPLRSLRKAGKPSLGGEATLNPQPLPPKSLGTIPDSLPGSKAASMPLRSFGKKQSMPEEEEMPPPPPKSLGKILVPTPGTNSALNPQPLPPRSFSFGRIIGRGVPEGEPAPGETGGGKPAATEGSPKVSSPVETPEADEKPAP